MRRYLLAFVVWLVVASSVEGATLVALDTQGGVDSLSSTPTNYTITATTAGNTIITAVASSCSSTTVGVSDASNGAHTVPVSTGGGGVWAAIAYFNNTAAGVTTISVTSSETCNGVVWIYEVSGVSGAPTTDSKFNSSTTAHECGSTGVTGTGFGVCAAMLTAGNQQTEGTGWLEATTPNNARFSQYKCASGCGSTTGTFSANDGPWTAAMAEASQGVMALFADSAVEVSGRGTLLGVGR